METEPMTHTRDYFETAGRICAALDHVAIERLADELVALRNRKGRLFVVGVGGSAANAGHLVNDFRKLCGIEAYAPTDNVAELTARTNDEGWDSVFMGWMKISHANDRDALLSYTDQQTHHDGGQGGFEIRTYIAISGATEGCAAEICYYRPIPIFAVGCTVGLVNLEIAA